MRAWYDGQSGAKEFPSCGNNTSYIGNAVAALNHRYYTYVSIVS